MQGISTSRRGASPSPIDHLTRQASANLITFYQKHLSPYKGFACAHRVLHGGESCSAYVKRTVLDQGWGTALPLVRQRFQDCKAANQTLRTRPKPWCRIQSDDWDGSADDPAGDASDAAPDAPDAPNSRQGRIAGGSFRRPAVVGNPTPPPPNNACPDLGCESLDCESLDCVSVGCDALDCANADWGFLDCSGVDCSSLDCSSADCSSLDCGSLDCGSCDVGSCG